MNTKITACVAICTRNRPQLLTNLLNSFVNLGENSRISLKLLIIENGHAGPVAPVIESFKGKLDIIYTHEPRAGLVYARNKAIETFLETDADWMISVDDDVIVNAKWINSIIDGINSFPNELAFTGPSIRLPPTPTNAWFTAYYTPQEDNKKLGEYFWDTSTANVCFNREIFSSDGFALRFDVSFNFSGGEDTRLFSQIKDLGIGIVWLNDAIIEEPTITERATISKLFKRNVAFAANIARIYNLRFPSPLNFVRHIFYGTMHLINTVTFLIVGAIILIFNERRGLSYLVKAFKAAAIGCGKIKSVFISEGTFYKETDGY